MRGLILGTILALAVPSIGFADELMESYTAKLSYKDHHNSGGSRLTKVAGIIRQDRANFHKFHRRDSADTWDRFFSSKSNRATMERMIRRGSISGSARNTIIYGTPTIKVRIYNGYGNGDYVKINILNRGSGSNRSSVR